MTQTANNYGEVLFELGIKKDTVEESKRIFSLTEQLLSLIHISEPTRR